MRVSDCPYAVGDPRHTEWIKDVYIPAMEADWEFLQQERRTKGAESIGAKFIRGGRITLAVEFEPVPMKLGDCLKVRIDSETGRVLSVDIFKS